MLLRMLFGLCSPGGTRGRLSVLIFHRVLPRPDPLSPGEVDVVCFENICRWLKSWCNVLPLDEAVSRMTAGRLPARAVSITFDDGYADNFTEALPILQRHGLTATFFIATAFLDGGRMWNDTVIESVRAAAFPRLNLADSANLRALGLESLKVTTTEEKRAAIEHIIGRIKYLPPSEREALAEQVSKVAEATLPDDMMMTAKQVLELRRSGMQIGAHTCSHPILSRLERSAACEEVATGKAFLENLLGERIGLFAYPNGKPGIDYSQESVVIVEQLGFDAAVSTASGAANAQTDRFQIPRFTPWKKTKRAFFLRLLANLWR